MQKNNNPQGTKRAQAHRILSDIKSRHKSMSEVDFCAVIESIQKDINITLDQKMSLHILKHPEVAIALAPEVVFNLPDQGRHGVKNIFLNFSRALYLKDQQKFFTWIDKQLGVSGFSSILHHIIYNLQELPLEHKQLLYFKIAQKDWPFYLLKLNYPKENISYLITKDTLMFTSLASELLAMRATKVFGKEMGDIVLKEVSEILLAYASKNKGEYIPILTNSAQYTKQHTTTAVEDKNLIYNLGALFIIGVFLGDGPASLTKDRQLQVQSILSLECRYHLPVENQRLYKLNIKSNLLNMFFIFLPKIAPTSYMQNIISLGEDKKRSFTSQNIYHWKNIKTVVDACAFCNELLAQDIINENSHATAINYKSSLLEHLDYMSLFYILEQLEEDTPVGFDKSLFAKFAFKMIEFGIKNTSPRESDFFKIMKNSFVFNSTNKQDFITNCAKWIVSCSYIENSKKLGVFEQLSEVAKENLNYNLSTNISMSAALAKYYSSIFESFSKSADMVRVSMAVQEVSSGSYSSSPGKNKIIKI